MDSIDLTMVIVTGTSLVALIALGIFVLIGMKIMKGSSSKKGSLAQDEEVRLIQEIYQGLSRMEQRIEALEIILFDRDRERGKNDL
jgi:phage shock protein B